MTINCFLQTEKNDPQKVALFYDRVRFYLLFFGYLFFGSLFFGYLFFGSLFFGCLFFGCQFFGSLFFGSLFFGSLFFGYQFFGCLIKGAISLCYKLSPWLRRIVCVRVADLLQYLLYG